MIMHFLICTLYVFFAQIVHGQEFTTTTLQPSPPDTTETPSPSLLITEDTCCGCIEESGESGCAADPTCETLVCDTVNDRCCERRWGFPCVETALTICSNLDTCCGCLNPGQSGGCRNDVECTGIICNNDEYCCNNQWDTLCVAQATRVCNGEELPVCCGCTSPTNFWGCLQDEQCEQLVCADDPFCCGQDENQSGVWDQQCVTAAVAVCTAEDTTTSTTSTTTTPFPLDE